MSEVNKTEVFGVVAAILGVFESPNEADANGEIANVVDGLFFIGRAINRLAAAVEGRAGPEADGDDAT